MSKAISGALLVVAGFSSDFLQGRRLAMSGPIGSAYPGNLVTSVFACFFLFVSARSALSAYRRRNGTKKPQSWEADVGVSIVAFLMFVLAFYAVWVHR
jgi:hypothetical protein